MPRICAALLLFQSVDCKVASICLLSIASSDSGTYLETRVLKSNWDSLVGGQVGQQQLVKLNHFITREYDGSFNHVFEFPNVARPAIALELGSRLRRESRQFYVPFPHMNFCKK